MARQIIGKVVGPQGVSPVATLTKEGGTLTISIEDAQGVKTESISTGEPVQSNWAESDNKSLAYIKNKPDLSDVALTGNYNDLSNVPTKLSDFTNDEGFLTKTDTVVVVDSASEPTNLEVGQYWEQKYN